MTIELPIKITTVKGFLDEDEGEALYKYALEASKLGPCFEIGSYCGKSTVYLGTACKENGSILFALDHHRGSEEHQIGEEYHDPDLFDKEHAVFDSFKEFRQTLKRANLENTVVPIVASSFVASRCWTIQLSMVFIDGGHSFESALNDYQSWACHVLPGGILAIHDIFPDPADGGQAPYKIWKMALASGNYEELEIVNTLGLLRRTDLERGL